MNDQFEPKMINLCVARRTRVMGESRSVSFGKLRNSRAHNINLACVVRLDLNHFTSQLDSPSFNQRLPKVSWRILRD